MAALPHDIPPIKKNFIHSLSFSSTMDSVKALKEWQDGMRDAVSAWFGPNSRTVLSMSDIGFAELTLQTPIEDEDEFLNSLPPNRRKVDPRYGENREVRWVYEFTPVAVAQTHLPAAADIPIPVAAVVPPTFVVTAPPPTIAAIVAAPAEPHWAATAMQKSIPFAANSLFICVVVIFIQVFYPSIFSFING